VGSCANQYEFATKTVGKNVVKKKIVNTTLLLKESMILFNGKNVIL